MCLKKPGESGYLHISEQFITLAEAIESETYPVAKRLVNADELNAC